MHRRDFKGATACCKPVQGNTTAPRNDNFIHKINKLSIESIFVGLDLQDIRPV